MQALSSVIKHLIIFVRKQRNRAHFFVKSNGLSCTIHLINSLFATGKPGVRDQVIGCNAFGAVCVERRFQQVEQRWHVRFLAVVVVEVYEVLQFLVLPQLRSRVVVEVLVVVVDVICKPGFLKLRLEHQIKNQAPELKDIIGLLVKEERALALAALLRPGCFDGAKELWGHLGGISDLPPL